jgi:branched-chain amino acid transport system permease protein
MNEITQPLPRVQAKSMPVGWYEFATTHRASLASLVVLLFPLVMPYTALAAEILIYGLYALGFNLVYGYLGLLSFGHAALFGAGAYFCGIAIAHFGLPWYAAIALGILGGLLMAALIGVLASRTRGIYFAMVTMALSQCVYYLFYEAVDWTGGENGLRGINIHDVGFLGLKLNFINPLTRYYVIAVFVIAAFFLLSRILASPFGAVIEAVRENEARAKASGYDVTLTRLMTFVLSGGFCGLAGALQALHLSIVPIEILHYDTSGEVVMIALLGGMGTFFGPMIGAATYLTLEHLVSNWTVHWQLIVGAIFVICVLFFPAGIWGTLIRRAKR